MGLKSTVIKHSVYVGGHNTSVSLEDEFWRALQEIANRANIPLAKLLSQIDGDRTNFNLSSAIRVFVLNYFRAGSGTDDRRSCSISSLRSSDQERFSRYV